MDEEKPDITMIMSVALQMTAVMFHRISEQNEEPEEVLDEMMEYLEPLDEERKPVMQAVVEVMEYASEVSLHMAVSKVNRMTGGIVINQNGKMPGLDETRESLLEVIYPKFKLKREGQVAEPVSEGEEGSDELERRA